MKNEIISKLTLLDTSLFRIKSLKETGVYNKEPKSFRNELKYIYNNLNLEDLQRLLKLKTTK